MLAPQRHQGQPLRDAPQLFIDFRIGHDAGCQRAVQGIDAHLTDHLQPLARLQLSPHCAQQVLDVLQRPRPQQLLGHHAAVDGAQDIEGLVQARPERAASQQPAFQSHHQAVQLRSACGVTAVLGRVSAHDICHPLKLLPRGWDLRAEGSGSKNSSGSSSE